MISCQNLSVKREENIVLRDINLEISRDVNLGIIGHNGSGKSTLVDLFAGKIFPFQGKVTKPKYSEVELVPRDYSFHRIVGAAYQYYQQRYHAYDAEIGPSVLEVLQNQAIPIGTVDAKSVTLPEPKYAIEWVKETAKKMNIAHLLDRKVTSLSNGETRRTLIAISLLKKPLLLILDNPFVGLDTESKDKLRQLLNEAGIQVILVASLLDMPKCIKRIIILKNGSLEKECFRPFPKQQELKAEIVLDQKLLNQFSTNNKTQNQESIIKLVNGKVAYNGKSVLIDVNWEVIQHEKWALLGANGSGKSTLISLLTGDNPQAYQNELYLFGKKRGTGESIWDIKGRIGYISPEMHLYFPKNMMVWKVVASGVFDTIGLFKTLRLQEEQAVNNIINLLNIDSLRDRPLNELSTGEQRIVLLARALVKNPELLLLDEPCQGLDFDRMIHFRDLINELALKLNKTLIYVSHNPEEIPACINKTIRLENGRMI
jgi:molybdate transport system ATP-binding protein